MKLDKLSQGGMYQGKEVTHKEAEKLEFLLSLNLPKSIVEIAESELNRQYSNICLKYPHAIKNMPEIRRYALLSIFCHIQAIYLALQNTKNCHQISLEDIKKKSVNPKMGQVGHDCITLSPSFSHMSADMVGSFRIKYKEQKTMVHLYI